MTTKKERYFVGLTGGAGGDGVDAVLAAVAGRGEAMRVRQVRREFTPHEPALRERIGELAAGKATTASDLAALDARLGRAFAEAAATLLKNARAARSKLAGVGLLGQTIARVGPADKIDAGGAMELGSPAIIAQHVGAPVAADFARADLAAGGAGAPLRAWPDWILFRHAAKTRVAVHLGSVASITFLPAGGLAADTVAFHAGPGVAAIDGLMRRYFDRPFDVDGAVAAAAPVDESLVHELLAAPYFHRRPPKTTGRADWEGVYLDRLALMAEHRGVDPAGMVAAATEVVVRSVAGAVGSMTENPHEVILCGGGAKNIHLAMRLRKTLTPASTLAAEHFKIDAEAVGALAAAVLAAARFDEVPANIPQSTGARRAAVLGSLTRA